MQNYKQQFKNEIKGKKITVMGLGLLGRGIGYTKFLAECGADLIVTDLKTKEQLAPALKELKKFKNIHYVLGEHRLEDFKDRDMIMKSAGVPLDSIYIAEAKKNNIPVEMDVSLFAKYAKGVQIVGVTGTRGKSMTTALIYHILKSNEKVLKSPSTLLGVKNPKVFLGGNVRGIATLPLLKQVKAGDILVCELDSWQLQGFGEAKISPHISVFTTFMPDHMNYYSKTSSSEEEAMQNYFDDKANIFKYHSSNDYLIILPEVKKIINKYSEVGLPNIKSKLIVADKKDVEDWNFIVPGEHQRANLACAVKVAELLGIPSAKIKSAVKKFEGVEGRLQYLKTVKGMKIYNDNNATTPQATIAGLKALGDQNLEARLPSTKNIVLIAGGADKNLDLKDLVTNINKYCKAVVLIPGTGTDKLLRDYKLKVQHKVGTDFKDVINSALEFSVRGKTSHGDILLFSPAFASFGMFNNEYDRNDQFVKMINKLK